MKIQISKFYTNPYLANFEKRMPNIKFGNFKDTFTRNPENGDKLQEVIKKIGIRKKGFPEVMISPADLTLSYAKGIINRDFYTNKYREESIPMYQRIELGKDKQELNENYSAEINMFRKISGICSQKELTDNEFRSGIEEILTSYASDNISRAKYIM